MRVTVAGTVICPGVIGVGSADIRAAAIPMKRTGRGSAVVEARRTRLSVTPSAAASARAWLSASAAALAIASLRGALWSRSVKLTESTRFAPAEIAASISAAVSRASGCSIRSESGRCRRVWP